MTMFYAVNVLPFSEISIILGGLKLDVATCIFTALTVVNTLIVQDMNRRTVGLE